MDDQQRRSFETQLEDSDVDPKLEEHQSPLTQDIPLLNLDSTKSTLKTTNIGITCPSINGSATYQVSSNQIPILSAWDRFRSWANRCWFFEISACLLHAIALGVITVVLIRFQHDALPQRPGHITINSLIAVLSTIMKGCMVYLVSEGISQLKWTWFTRPRQLSALVSFDAASRGPWGSFMFLTSRTPDALALLGAIITILALAVDPFAQQIVAYYPCTITDPTLQATLSRVSWFDPFLDLGGPAISGPSIKTYNGVVTSGKLEEFEIASEDLEYIVDDVYAYDGFYPLEYETEQASGCAFFLGEEMLYTTKAWIDPLLSRSIFGDPDYIKSGLGAQAEGGSATDKNPTAMHLSALLLEGGATVATVDAWVGAIAQAITLYMRSNVDTSIPGNEPSIGEAQAYHTCMSVRWPWLLLPATLSVMTMVFLFAIILKSNRSAAEPHCFGLWKSSILALLLHESSDVEFQQYSGPIDPISLQCSADHVITTLQRRPLLQMPVVEDDV